MNILVNRKWFTRHSTIGEMFLGSTDAAKKLNLDVPIDPAVDKEFCYTLEPPKEPITYIDQPGVNPKIVYRCIPAGTYRLERRHSVHFKMDVLAVLDVPGRSDIEIHFGNYGEPHSIGNIRRPPDTEGCTCVGYDRSTIVPDFIGSSKVALDALLAIVFPILESGEEVWITYVDNPIVEAQVTKSPKVIEVDQA